MTQYSINIADLTKDGIVAQFLIAPVVPHKQVVNAEKGYLDGGAVLLECEEERAKAIVSIIRGKYHRNLLRCYESKTGKSWVRI